MDSKAKWEAILTATQEKPSSLGLFQFTMGAEENAHETVFVDRAATEADYFDLCISSLAGLLCYTDDTRAQDFFAGLGVRF